MQAVWTSTKSGRRTTEQNKHAGKVVEPMRRSNMCCVFGQQAFMNMNSPLMMP